MTSTLPLETPAAARVADGPSLQRRDRAAHRVDVPWSHVLPLAVVLSFANGFWLISVRGAVGSIERTSEPFESWLRESSLLVPAYVAAVVAAFALGHRWFGARPRGARATAAALGLVAGSAWAAGVLIQAASTMLDLRLQVDSVEHMSAHSSCGSTCLSQRIQDTWHLDLEAVVVGAALLAVTDLVVVALVYAARGGNLLLGAARKRPSSATDGLAGADERILLATGLVGAALIHVAVIPEHLREWQAAGVFFVVLSLAELAAAPAVLSRRRGLRERSLWAAAAVSLLPLGVWAVSRSVGLPFGPEAGEPEPIGVADYLACVLEVTTLLLAVGLLVRQHRLRTSSGSTRAPRPWSRYALAVAVATMVTATTVGVAGSTLPVVGAFPGVSGHHGEGDSTEGAP